MIPTDIKDPVLPNFRALRQNTYKKKTKIEYQIQESLANGVASSSAPNHILIRSDCRLVHSASALTRRSIVIHFNLGNQEDVIRGWGAGRPPRVAGATKSKKSAHNSTVFGEDRKADSRREESWGSYLQLFHSHLPASVGTFSVKLACKTPSR